MDRKPLQPKPFESFALADATQNDWDPKTRIKPFRWLSQQDHIRVDFWGQRFIVRLHAEGCNLARANAGAPFKFLHQVNGQASIIGNIVENSMTLSGKFDGRGAARLIEFPECETECKLEDERAAMKVAYNYMRPVSMDAIPTKTRIEEFPDDPAQLPIVHWDEWEVVAVSSVPIAQDPGATTMEAQMSTKHDPNAMPAAAAADPKPQPEAPDVAAIEAAAQASAIERFEVASELAQVFGLDKKAELAIAKGKEPLDVIRKRLISERAAKGDALGIQPGQRVEFGRDEGDTIREAIIECFEARATGKPPTDRAKRFMGRKWDPIARAYMASRASEYGYREDMDDLTVERLSLGFGAGGAVAPSDLPVLLTQGTQRALVVLAAEADPMVWQELVRNRSVDNFNEVKLVRRMFAGQMEEIPTNGVAQKPFTVGEDYETGAVKAWGGAIEIGRTAAINDDLGSLADLPAEILKTVREHQTDRFWSVFLTGTLRDGKAVCHADHANVVASAGAGPGTLAQLSKMRVLFAKAVDGERKLRLRMTHVIVPEILRDEASQIISGVIQANEASKTVPGYYRTLSVLSDPALDDSSTKKWYAAAAAVPCFTFLRLKGQENPTVEQERIVASRAVRIYGFADYNIVPSAYQGLAYNKGEN